MKQQHGVHAKKKFGQHFLINPDVTQKTVENTLLFGVSNILEVGPGMGVLTKEFIYNAQLNFKCIEIDREAIAYLKIQYPELQNKLIEGDFLQLDISKIFQGDFLLLGNFPYNISTQIVFRLLENKESICGMVGMFQKEVAERIIAPPGSKTYGILSVLTAAFYEGALIAKLGPADFNPPPKVDSAVIVLRRKNPLPDINYEKLKKLVKAAFNQRRKTLRNSLNGLVDFNNEAINQYEGLRPEQLHYTDFLQLMAAGEQPVTN